MNLFSVLRNSEVTEEPMSILSTSIKIKKLQEASTVFACVGHFSLGLLSLPQSHSKIKLSSSFIQAHTDRPLQPHSERPTVSTPADLSGRVSSFMNQSWRNIYIRCHFDHLRMVGHQMWPMVPHQTAQSSVRLHAAVLSGQVQISD